MFYITYLFYEIQLISCRAKCHNINQNIKMEASRIRRARSFSGHIRSERLPLLAILGLPHFRYKYIQRYCFFGVLGPKQVCSSSIFQNNTVYEISYHSKFYSYPNRLSIRRKSNNTLHIVFLQILDYRQTFIWQ